MIAGARPMSWCEATPHTPRRVYCLQEMDNDIQRGRGAKSRSKVLGDAKDGVGSSGVEDPHQWKRPLSIHQNTPAPT
jgi:hypothetical protein